ncbi:Cactin [Sesamum angolense]|uniref:Cactin n=1 Tax=Sesamum angolense TaxID=2727404 RepID=A0AAE1WM56_9LAMI|nr:Cactin [Sesamum angolense]
MTSSSRNRRRYSSDDPSSDSASDINGRMSRGRRSRRSSDSDSDEPSKRKSKKKITEDDIAEYMAKKAHKKAMKVAKKLKSQIVSGYSNDSNPFGDSNLNEKFVWRKKIERDVTQGVPLDEFSIKAEKKRQRERMVPFSLQYLLGAEVHPEEEPAGSYSPQLLHGDENEDAIDPEEDKAILDKRRNAVLEERRIQELASRPTPPEDHFEKNAMKAMGAMEEGDVVFGTNDEINLDSQVYWWHDKYRPRKPKYFNRVHTGYEWNKYNQTHYDHDNPPPKIVQGYKFNIFYPDLVDKSKAPTYTIEKDGDSTETCIIRFHAGPPYEDIVSYL